MFRRFENPQNLIAAGEGVGLVANMLKGKALEVYDMMSVEDLEVMSSLRSLRLTS